MHVGYVFNSCDRQDDYISAESQEKAAKCACSAVGNGGGERSKERLEAVVIVASGDCRTSERAESSCPKIADVCVRRPSSAVAVLSVP